MGSYAFSVDSAVVAWRELGFARGALTYIDDEYGLLSGRARFWLDRVQCNGNESRLIECPHDPWGVKNQYCRDDEQVVIRCEGDPSDEPEVYEEGSLKIVGGESPGEGFLMIYHNGMFGHVVEPYRGYHYRDDDKYEKMFYWGGFVACREMGY